MCACPLPYGPATDSRGILHRDIKPENVVFESDDHSSVVVKVIDFGTAVALEERGAKVSSGGRIGTWSYWAPEQLNQQPYDFAVDMWSLGILLYILLVGFHPFDPNGDATEQQILDNMKTGKITFDDEEWAKVSPKAKTLVTSLLQKDPEKRLTANELIAHPWCVPSFAPAHGPLLRCSLASSSRAPLGTGPCSDHHRVHFRSSPRPLTCCLLPHPSWTGCVARMWLSLLSLRRTNACPPLSRHATHSTVRC